MERALQTLCQGERQRGVESRALVVGTSRETTHELVDGVPVTRAASWRAGSVWLRPLIDRPSAEGRDRHPGPARAEPDGAARALRWHGRSTGSRSGTTAKWSIAVAVHADVRAVPQACVSPGVADRRVVSRAAGARAGARAHAGRCRRDPLRARRSPRARARRPSGRRVGARAMAGPIALFVGRLVSYKGWSSCCGRSRKRGRRSDRWRRPAARIARRSRRPTRRRFTRVLCRRRGRWGAGGLVGACDIFVLPSVTRRSLRTGAARGDGPGKAGDQHAHRDRVPWVNIDGYTGLTVPPSDAAALAGALRRLAGDSDLRRRMGANARDRFTMEFTAASMIDRTIAMYKRIEAEPMPSPPLDEARLRRGVVGRRSGISAPLWAVACRGDQDRRRRAGVLPAGARRQNGSLFTVLKFRSMVVHAERDHGPRQAGRGRHACTRVGRLDAGHGHGRAAAAREHLQGRHELRRPAGTRAGEIETAAMAGSFRWKRSRATANARRSNRD